MKKHLVAVIGIASILAMCLISGCAEDIEVDCSHVDVPENIDTDEEITADHFQTKDGEYVHFCGHSKLPQGTYLQTQLYVGGEPEPWWPADKYVKVRNGKWQINVRLGKNGAPQALLVGPTYVFEVWEKDNPSVMATFSFDLNPPPSPAE